MGIPEYFAEASRIYRDVERVIAKHKLWVNDDELYFRAEQYHAARQAACGIPKGNLRAAALKSTSDPDVRRRIEAVDDALSWFVSFSSVGQFTEDFRRAGFALRDALRALEPWGDSTTEPPVGYLGVSVDEIGRVTRNGETVELKGCELNLFRKAWEAAGRQVPIEVWSAKYEGSTEDRAQAGTMNRGNQKLKALGIWVEDRTLIELKARKPQKFKAKTSRTKR